MMHETQICCQIIILLCFFLVPQQFMRPTQIQVKRWVEFFDLFIVTGIGFFHCDLIPMKFPFRVILKMPQIMRCDSSFEVITR